MATVHEIALQARGVLAARAKTFSIISYQELADLVSAGIPNGRVMRDVLNEVSTTCTERGEPDLAALIACQDTGLPSNWSVSPEVIAKERVGCYDYWGFWTQRK